MSERFLVGSGAGINAREHLIRRIHYVLPTQMKSYAVATDIADEILREGYQLPRAIKHYRDLDALGYGALVRAENGHADADYYEKSGEYWTCLTDPTPKFLEVEKIALPVHVLWEGKVK